MKRHSVEFWFHYVSNKADTWRQRLGMLLRDTADRVDGRISLGIEMLSMPALTELQRREIIILGQKHMADLFAQTVQLEAEERLLREMSPELFEDQPQ